MDHRQWSWLRDRLWSDQAKPWVESAEFVVGLSTFWLVYNPDAGELPNEHCGSLAICLWPDTEALPEACSLCYRIYIKARDGSFAQWGESGHHYYDSEADELDDDCQTSFGPDVHWAGYRPATPTALGIFGLTHEELLQSEWVDGDVMTVKCVLDVRCCLDSVNQSTHPAVELPESSIVLDMQRLLENGNTSDLLVIKGGMESGSHDNLVEESPLFFPRLPLEHQLGDVRFMVQDEVIYAHSPVLCARLVE